MKQKQPAKLDKAVSATLEMEDSSVKPGWVATSVQGEDDQDGATLWQIELKVQTG